MAASAALQAAVSSHADHFPGKTAAGMFLFQMDNITLQYFHALSFLPSDGNYHHLRRRTYA